MITKGKLTWEDGTPVEGYLVQLMDNDSWRNSSKDDFVGDTYTDANGNWSITHDRKQDRGTSPKKYGDFYIKILEKAEGFRFYNVYRSKIYENFSGATLEINVQILKAHHRKGKNILYGDAKAVHPDGRVEELNDCKVKAYDYNPGRYVLGQNLNRSDYLGESDVKSGDYMVTFMDGDFGNENMPDVFLRLIRNGHMLFQRGHYTNCELPLHKNFIIPVHVVKGKVGKLRLCRNGDYEEESNWGGIKVYLEDFEGITNSEGAFEITVYGRLYGGTKHKLEFHRSNKFLGTRTFTHEFTKDPEIYEIGDPYHLSEKPCEKEKDNSTKPSAPRRTGEPTFYRFHNENDKTRNVYKVVDGNRIFFFSIPPNTKDDPRFDLTLQCGQSISLVFVDPDTDEVHAGLPITPVDTGGITLHGTCYEQIIAPQIVQIT